MCAGTSAQLGWSSLCDMLVQWPPELSYTLDPFSVTHGFRFFQSSSQFFVCLFVSLSGRCQNEYQSCLCDLFHQEKMQQDAMFNIPSTWKFSSIIYGPPEVTLPRVEWL